MRSLLLFSMLIYFAFSPLIVKSTHIVGGEMHYEHIANYQYKVTLVVYRDYCNGDPWFDSPAYVAVFDSSYNRIKNISLTPMFLDTVPLEILDSCTYVESVCYEVGTYEFIDSFPPIDGGYILVYDRCCWNHTVDNIYKPESSGLTVLSTIPDSSFAMNNTSPVFKNRTPVFLCVNRYFEFDHSAIDKDGDSLTYELFTPYNSSRDIGSEKPPLQGPYFPLIYMPGYSLDNVMGSNVPLAIDASTGLLTVTHGNKIGQFVFGVRVIEWREGVKIGFTERTYQINSQQCRRYTTASFTNPISQCGDSIVFFDNKSDSSIAYLWHYGDNNSNDSTSNVKEPNHIYSGFGQYKVTLIAYSYQGDECNDTIQGSVNLYPNLNGEYIFIEDKCSNFVQFNDITQSPFGAVNKWQWDFGDGKGAIVKDPYHQFNLSDIPKTYTVTLFVESENGCKDTVSQLYTGENRKYTINSIKASKYQIYPRDDSTLLTVDADTAVFYSWSPKDGLSSPNESTTYANPSKPTIYKVIAKDGRGCPAEEKIEIDVFKYSCGETSTFVPNAFSPNGDGENDFLRIRGEEITDLNLSVYNRWGQLVFQSSDVGMISSESLGWNGDFKGQIQDPGVYVYTAEITCSDKRTFKKKGNVTLIR